MVGVRTARTLADRDAWMRVNRFTGYVAVGLGVVIVLSALIPPDRGIRNVVSAAAIAAASAIAIGYWRDAVARPSRACVQSLWRVGADRVTRGFVSTVFLYAGVVEVPGRS